ncbi:MAG: GNAT family N-acetyltransferase [Pseudomonadota bacterium]
MIPTLHTKRLTLRPPTPADEADFVRFHAVSDVNVGAYRRRSAEDAKARLAFYIAEWARNGHGMWVLDLGGEMIGGAGIVWERDWPCHELTWFLFPEHRGEGYASEASKAVIAWGYDVLGFDPVETYIRDENAPARALAARLGGEVARRETFPDGVTRDVFALPHPNRPKPLFPERLTSDRLIYRRPIASDCGAYTAFGAGDRTDFTGGPFTAEQATKSFYALIGQWEARGYGRWIFCTRDGRPLGHVGPLHLEDAAEPEMSWTVWSGEDEGKGYATEAAAAVRDAWLDTDGAPEMFAVVHEDNIASQIVAKKIGGVEDPEAPKPYWSDKAITYRWARA